MGIHQLRDPPPSIGRGLLGSGVNMTFHLLKNFPRIGSPFCVFACFGSLCFPLTRQKHICLLGSYFQPREYVLSSPSAELTDLKSFSGSPNFLGPHRLESFFRPSTQKKWGNSCWILREWAANRSYPDHLAGANRQCRRWLSGRAADARRSFVLRVCFVCSWSLHDPREKMGL